MFKLSDIENEINEEENRKKESQLLEMDKVIQITIRDCDEKQLNILGSSLDEYLVTGPAGSGKSMIAMIKAMELYNNNNKFRIIIYTKALSEFIIGKLKRVDIKNIKDYILCGYEFQKEDISEDIDYIIIDEVQDFNLKNIEYCRNMAKKGCFLFGDDLQQIYPKNTDGKNIIKNLIDSDIKLFKLEKTYRFPKKIAFFSELIKDNHGDISNLCIEEGGDENTPRMIEFKNRDAEMTYIVDTIKNEGWKDVGILVRNNDMAQIVYDELRKKGCICDYKIKDEMKLDFTNDNPKILTYHSSKGLEFERVFIPQCDVDEDDSTNLNLREALYVACTRTSKTLILSYIKSFKSPFLNGINSKYYKFERR
ncbi:3'-5' exonuclease [Clostridium septicum]|uniref:ATP-binding domain-containing protein n=1 Tax=Clostridium septicum TaxID=1504 RepID=A0ABY5B2C5_CLOSE|nr:3'-5' exonuclease [Clostridium septicum]UEC20018.1 ATP-binding domain-containing protein [Clostridium septicum]USS01925.1 ATP-binding domain-containing protein [Clostridium septicum]